MTGRVGIGVVGAGRMGSIHARLIARSVAEAHLAGIADVNLAAARRLADELGGTPVFGSLAEMLARPGVDAVLIATSVTFMCCAPRQIASMQTGDRFVTFSPAVT